MNTKIKVTSIIRAKCRAICLEREDSCIICLIIIPSSTIFSQTSFLTCSSQLKHGIMCSGALLNSQHVLQANETNNPSISAVRRSARMVFVGRLPSKTRCGASHPGVFSALSSPAVLPSWAICFSAANPPAHRYGLAQPCQLFQRIVCHVPVSLFSGSDAFCANPDKPQKLPQRPKGAKKKCLLKFFFVSWWRRCFGIKCKKNYY